MPLSMRQALRDQTGTYLPRLIAVAYAVFDPTQGPKIVYQVPEGVIATALNAFPTRTEDPAPISNAEVLNTSQGMIRSTSGQGIGSAQVLFDFSSVLEFVIPKPELCGNLITKATRTSKILGFPVRIFNEEKYHKGRDVYNRNAFIFNLCFVFERDAELSGFEPLVRKTARTLRTLEETVSLLSDPPSTFSMADLLEQLFMDINSYSETSIPIHDTHLDLMLFPFYANPRDIHMWEVPIAVTSLEKIKNGSWDVTLFKVCSFIDGVNTVKRIAELAEVDGNLGRLCIQHLLFYSAIILVDLFQFSNSYAPLSGIAETAQYGEEDDDGVTDLREECEAYVYSGSGETPTVSFATLLQLYSKLRPGLSVSEWMEENFINSDLIDVRRMIQFGVIKGFLRRSYAYPIWLDHPSLSASIITPQTSPPTTKHPALHRETTSSTFASTASTTSSTRPPLARQESSSTFSDASQLSYPSSLGMTPGPLLTRRITPIDSPAPPLESSAYKSNSSRNPTKSQVTGIKEEEVRPAYPGSLPFMLDGKHHTDEICIRYGMALKQLQVALKLLGTRNGQEGTGKEGKFGSRLVMLYV